MRTARYTFKTLPLEWRDHNRWREADLSSQSEATQTRFDRYARALRLYLDRGALSAACREAGCSATSLLGQLNRCVELHEDGTLVGWPALIAYQRITRYRRRANLPSGQRNAEQGAAGSFERFLEDYPDLRDRLWHLIRKGGGSQAIACAKPTLRGIASRFIALCRATLGDGEYPLNSRSQGRRSIERYVRAFIPTDPESVATWYGAEANVRLLLGTGKHGFPWAMAPFDVVGVDAHKIHCTGVIIVNGPAGPQIIPINRLWLVPGVDYKSRAILGYSLSIRKEITAANVEAALVSFNHRWTPRKLRVAGLQYGAGAGMPVGSVEGLNECRPAVILVDNAAQHYAKRIIYAARKTLGCAINFGPVGAWWHNAITERLFRTLEIHGFQCLPSSTGSNPTDPLRGDSVREAMRNAITWDELVDLVDVLVADYNAHPHSSLGGQSPLDVLRNHLRSSEFGFMPRLAVPSTVNAPRLGWTVERRPVAGASSKHRLVRPHVQVDKVRYTSPALSDRFDLLGIQLTLHVNEADMRSVLAFTETGEPLGELKALNTGWANTLHTRGMRKEINALLRTRTLDSNAQDFVLSYVDYLARGTLREAVRKSTNISPTATKLAEVAQITGAAIPRVDEIDVPRQGAQLRPMMPGHIKPPPWA